MTTHPAENNLIVLSERIIGGRVSAKLTGLFNNRPFP
jgi:hypothetical protein